MGLLIYFFLVVVLSVASACQSKIVPPALPKPKLTRITTFDPPGFTVSWDPVQSNERTPITGLKVKVWEVEKEAVNQYHAEQIDGKIVFTEETKYVAKPFYKFPKNAPELTRVLGPNVTEATFENVKVNEDYEIRMQAFNDNGDGPYSNALGIKLHGNGK